MPSFVNCDTTTKCSWSTIRCNFDNLLTIQLVLHAYHEFIPKNFI